MGGTKPLFKMISSGAQAGQPLCHVCSPGSTGAGWWWRAAPCPGQWGEELVLEALWGVELRQAMLLGSCCSQALRRLGPCLHLKRLDLVGSIAP